MSEVGKLIRGRFRIDKQLSRDPLASKYEGVDTQRSVPVIVEVIDTPLGLTSANNPFIREAEVWKGLHHSNIPELEDFFILGNKTFIVTLLIEGRNLFQIIDENGSVPLPEEKALEIMLQVLDAVSYAHKQGVLFRDIKPNNIIITNSGKVFLVDYGIARKIDDRASPLVSSTPKIYTSGFSAPEGTSGKETGSKVDVYSLGAVLYYLLTGFVPIDAFDRLLDEKLISPRQLNPAISIAVEQIILYSMDLDYSKRPSVDDMRAALIDYSSKPKFVFISYAKEDFSYADFVYAGLHSRGLQCWMAPKDIKVNLTFPLAIIDGIKKSKVFLLVLSNSANKSKHVAREVNIADENNLLIICLRKENIKPEGELDYFLRNIQWVDAFDILDEDQLNNLAIIICEKFGEFPDKT